MNKGFSRPPPCFETNSWFPLVAMNFILTIGKIHEVEFDSLVGYCAVQSCHLKGKYSDGNCNVCRNAGKLSTFDAAPTRKRMFDTELQTHRISQTFSCNKVGAQVQIRTLKKR
jgi:hypothetical protein